MKRLLPALVVAIVVALSPCATFARNAEDYFFYGEWCMESASSSREYREAVKMFSKAIELNPKWALAYTNRGLAYEKLGKYQQALKDHNKAIALDPKFTWAYINRGFTYLHLGKYQEAITSFTKAIALKKYFYLGDAYYGRACAYRELGKHTQAIEDLKAAARWDDKDAQAILRERGIAW